ncbi:phospholipid carrier-dependent glycosyltransferase [bacterium]|nr:phospholipid carrier-dependent glycosyltransferase [bacterium]
MTRPEPSNPSRALEYSVLFVVLAAFVVLCAVCSRQLSPCVDEPTHIRSGANLLTRQKYTDPERIWWTKQDALHPPMDMLPAAVAILAGQSPDFRGDMFTSLHALRAARWVNHLIGAAMLAWVFFWARRIWGRRGGWLAMLLLMFQPLFIAHSSIVSTDLYMALGTLLGVWSLWRLYFAGGENSVPYTQGLRLWSRLILAGVAIGLAMFCKVGNMVLLGMVPIFAFAGYARFTPQLPIKTKLLRTIIATAVIDAAALIVAAGLFGWGAPEYIPLQLHGHAIRLPLGHSLAISIYTAMHVQDWIAAPVWLGSGLRAPGLSMFLIASLLKTPIPILIMLVLALPLSACAAKRRGRLFEFALLLAVTVGFIVLLTTRNIYLGVRHLMPAFVLLSVLAGAMTVLTEKPGFSGRIVAALIVVALGCSGFIATRATPWQLSYLNAFARSPMALVDSDLDWGQGLIALHRWQERNSPDRPIWLAYFGQARPEDYGIRYRGLPSPMGSVRLDPEHAIGADPQRSDGYVAISATDLAGAHNRVAGLKPDTYARWRKIKPVAIVGGSILVFGDSLQSRGSAQ